MPNNTLIQAQEDWPDKIDEIHQLKYIIEFFPHKHDYTDTTYSLELETINENTLNIAVTYEKVDLTEFGKNFDYNVSSVSYKIYNTSLPEYDIVMIGTYSEIFVNLTEAISGNPQNFRVDELVIFSNYLITEKDDEIETIEQEFNYIDMEEYSRNLNFTYYTYHYNTSKSWSHGCTG
ncbi:MAG: hypothetical protein ACTSWY_13905 [Promethearchaeota archaeon]